VTSKRSTWPRCSPHVRSGAVAPERFDALRDVLRRRLSAGPERVGVRGEISPRSGVGRLQIGIGGADEWGVIRLHRPDRLLTWVPLALMLVALVLWTVTANLVDHARGSITSNPPAAAPATAPGP